MTFPPRPWLVALAGTRSVSLEYHFESCLDATPEHQFVVIAG